MAIRRLTPQVKREDLGYLQLWRDELVAMIATLRQLKDISLDIQADGYQLDDVDSDLPNIGKARIDEFKVTVTKAQQQPDASEILELKLSRETCYVEAVEPDPEVRGVISDIVELASKYRRLPRWTLPGWSRRSLRGYSYIVGTGILGCLFGTLLIASPGPNAPPFYIRVLVLVAGILFLIISLPLIVLSRTVIFTGTRASAPTFWQRYRAEIMIGLIVSALFYVLGLLTAH